jgi:hypothetical protein
VQIRLSRWALILVVETRQKAPKQKAFMEEGFRLLTFVDIPAFICTYLLRLLAKILIWGL